jgi:hypothetical protein
MKTSKSPMALDNMGIDSEDMACWTLGILKKEVRKQYMGLAHLSGN